MPIYPSEYENSSGDVTFYTIGRNPSSGVILLDEEAEIINAEAVFSFTEFTAKQISNAPRYDF